MTLNLENIVKIFSDKQGVFGDISSEIHASVNSIEIEIIFENILVKKEVNSEPVNKIEQIEKCIQTINKQIKKCDILDFIQNNYKTELHLHLEGFVDKDIFKMLDTSKSESEINKIYIKQPFDIFGTIADTISNNFNHCINIILIELYKNRLSNKIFYTQLQYTAYKFAYRGTHKISVKDQFNHIIKTIYEITQNSEYNGIVIDFILDFPRSIPSALIDDSSLSNYTAEINSLIKQDKYKNYIRGFGIGGRDENRTLSKYKNQINKLSNNIQYIPHAGEFGDTETICNSISDALLYSRRLGHGVRILECTDPSNNLKFPPTYIPPDYNRIDRSNNISCDICITSNITFIKNKSDRTAKFTYDNHPVYDLINKGYIVSLSTDDPGILFQEDNPSLNITLFYEYTKLLNIILSNNSNNFLDAIKIILNVILNGYKSIFLQNISVLFKTKFEQQLNKQLQYLYTNIKHYVLLG